MRSPSEEVENPFNNAQDLKSTKAEFRLQIAVIKHLESAFPQVIFTHIPNQGNDAKGGYFKKMMGSKAGAPDLILWFTGGCAAIELKADKGRVSTAQNKFLSALASKGVYTGVCRSVKEVHDMLCRVPLTPRHHWQAEPDLRSRSQKYADAFDIYRRE